MSFKVVVAWIAASVAVGMCAGPAAAGATDASATKAYVAANYTLVKSARSYLRRAEEAPLKVLTQVTRECPLAAAKSPQDPESTQLSDEVIGAMVIAAYHLDIPALHRFISAVTPLHWSRPRLTHAVRGYAAKLKVLAGLAPPHLCADVRAWVAGGYKSLPPSTVRFDALFMPAWVALGELPAALKQYERPEEKSMLTRSHDLEFELIDGEARAVESWGKIMNELELEP